MQAPYPSPLAVSVCLAITGCGGGGGPSATTGALVRPDVPFHTPVRINGFQPLSGDTYRTPMVETYARDLNGDGRQELIMQSSSFAPSAAEWRNGSLQIFGWNSGTFKNETSSWFSGTDNVYMGGTTLKFGDFRGNGRVDMFAATFTDRNDIYGPSVVYFNNGNSTFQRANIDFGQVDGHDSHVTDLNGDGFGDIIVVDWSGRTKVAFGSAAGTFNIVGGNPAWTGAQRNPGATSISVADYLGDGTKTMVITDGPSDGLADTQLYSWKVENGFLAMTKIANLPVSRFYMSKWDTQRAAVTASPHEVRNFAFDFNRDGRPDVVVIAALDSKTQTNAYTEVQFLRNDGGGRFTDVTDSVLVGFDPNKQPSYNPQLVDVNNDGLMDIFLSAQGPANNSVLIQTTEGKFVESFGMVLKDFTQQMKSMTDRAVESVTVALVKGPDGVLYIASGVIYNQADYNASARVAVYLSRLGDANSMTAPATITSLQQIWPWMSPAQANETLVRTATQWVDGVPVINLTNVFNPVGGLGITLDHRLGERRPIFGHIVVPGLRSSHLSNVTAIDGLGRNFQIDLSRMSLAPSPSPVVFSLIDQPGQSWASRFASSYVPEHNGFSATGDANNWTTGVTSRAWGWQSPYLLNLSATLIQGSPWLGLSGIFGSVTSSTILDTSVTRHWSSGAWAQAGIMQTVTAINPGLVRSIDPIFSAYAIAGYRTKSWTLHGGLQPTIFSGSMDLRLPTSVDSQGVLHYTDSKVQIRNQPVGFVGGGPRWQAGNHLLSLDAVANTASRYQVMLKYRLAM